MLFTCMHINSAWTISDVWCFPCYLLYTLLSVGHSMWHVQMAQVKWGKRNSNPGSSSWNNRVVPLFHNTFSNYKLLEKLKWKKFSPKLVESKVLSFPITPSFPFTRLATCHQNQLLRQKLVTFKLNMVPSNMLEYVNECTSRLILSPAYIGK